jgi:hypothetical protein
MNKKKLKGFGVTSSEIVTKSEKGIPVQNGLQ